MSDKEEKEKKIPWPFECFLYREKDDGSIESQKVSSFSNDFNRQEYQANPLCYSPSEREVAEKKAKAKAEELQKQGWFGSPDAAKAGKAEAAKREEEIQAAAAKLAEENKAKEIQAAAAKAGGSAKPEAKAEGQKSQPKQG